MVGSYKKIKSIKELKRGDIVIHASGEGGSWVVNDNYGDRVTAVNSRDITNPIEWLVWEPNKNPILR